MKKLKILKKILYKTLVCYIVLMFLYFIKIGGNKGMESFIAEYWLEFLFGLLSGSILYILKKIYGLYKRQKAVEQGVQALLRNELIRRYREYESKGEITILDKENIEHMFKEYTNLGGNGTVKAMYEDLLELPIKIIRG